MFRVDVQTTSTGSRKFSESFCTYSSKQEALESATDNYSRIAPLLADGQRLRIMVTKVLQVTKGNRIVNEYEEVAHFNADMI